MTRLFGVIGHPICHSLSPAMHNAALGALRCDALYAPFDVPPRFLRPMLRGLVLAGVEGLNVTVPLKEVVLPLLDRVDPVARAIGAVNTLLVRDRTLIGYNTDGIGCRHALEELGWRAHRPTRAVLLGAGGAARAVAWELTRASGSCLVIANRRLSRAQRLARWVARHHPRACVRGVSLQHAPLDEAEVVVNATTVGMHPTDRWTVDLGRLRRGTLVYDLVYHRQTPLVQLARRRGCVAANGLSMLLYQAAESLRLWVHRRPPVEVMRRALVEEMEREAHMRRARPS